MSSLIKTRNNYFKILKDDEIACALVKSLKYTIINRDGQPI